MLARLFRPLRLPARLSPWRWHCLGIAFLLLELAFLAWVLMRQPPPTQPPPALPPPLESSDIGPAATFAPTLPSVRPLPRRRPATPPRFFPTLAGRATPAPPTLAPPAAATPAPVLPTITATPAAAQTPPTTPSATPPASPTLPAAVPSPTPPAPPPPQPVATATLTPAPAPTPTLPPTPIPQVTAGIALRPDSDTVAVGRQFQLRIRVQAGATNPVDAVQVYLVFDPARFAAVSLTAGPALEVPLQSDIDNDLGRLDYAAGTLGPAVAVPFTLTTVTFRALSPTGPPGTYITFAALQSPRHTKAVAGGANITGNLTSAYLLVE